MMTDTQRAILETLQTNEHPNVIQTAALLIHEANHLANLMAIDPDVMLDAYLSALLGEYEPIRQYRPFLTTDPFDERVADLTTRRYLPAIEPTPTDTPIHTLPYVTIEASKTDIGRATITLDGKDISNTLTALTLHLTHDDIPRLTLHHRAGTIQAKGHIAVTHQEGGHP